MLINTKSPCHLTTRLRPRAGMSRSEAAEVLEDLSVAIYVYCGLDDDRRAALDMEGTLWQELHKFQDDVESMADWLRRQH